MDREHKQLVSAIKHYWILCKRQYSRVNPETKYLDELGDKDKNASLYSIHLASCCFRIATWAENSHERQDVYEKLREDSNYQVKALELSILIRDTISHHEVTGHKKYEPRKKYLGKLTIGEIHSVIDDLVSSILSGTF